MEIRLLLAGSALAVLCGAVGPALAAEKVDAVLDIAPVWSAHPVGFALLTHGKHQFVAFYDAERRMTIASRTIAPAQPVAGPPSPVSQPPSPVAAPAAWHFVRLPQTLGWDSHNYIAMALDDDGYLHVSGNMHCVPLIYFRSTRPYDIDSLEQVPAMTGEREKSCTYPRFLRGAGNELLFTYRDGRSGSGDQIWNAYDLKSRTWHRLLDQPLFAGGGKMNAYFHGPTKGPDGTFHICWVWRNSGDCATNHDLSYARSKDLVHWETSAGKPLALPITIATAEVVDPVPPGGGIINGNTLLGWDSKKRPIITYHKYDAKGNLQIYNARLEEGKWRSTQVTNWDYRWDFHGGGSMVFEVRPGAVQLTADGKLVQSYWHTKYGSGAWVLDEATLKPVGPAPKGPASPLAAYGKPESAFPEMEVRWAGDQGAGDEPGVHYRLRWESLPSHQDRPRTPPLPDPVMLKLFRIRDDAPR